MDSGQYFTVDNINPSFVPATIPSQQQPSESDYMSDASTIISDSEQSDDYQEESALEEAALEEASLEEAALGEALGEALEEEALGEANNIENKHATYDCSVCYKTLNMDNNVTTKCQHHFCDQCFYRWIQTNASCPMCRTPIDTNTHLTQEQLTTALSIEYRVYVETLEKSNNITSQIFRLQKKYDKLNKKFDKLTNNTNMLVNRQISLRALNDQTEASNDGIICAGLKYMGRSDHMNTGHYKSLYTPYLHGAFCSAYEREKERLDLMNNPDVINELPVKKFRKIEKNNEQEELKFSFTPSSSETPQSWVFTSPNCTEI